MFRHRSIASVNDSELAHFQTLNPRSLTAAGVRLSVWPVTLTLSVGTREMPVHALKRGLLIVSMEGGVNGW